MRFAPAIPGRVPFAAKLRRALAAMACLATLVLEPAVVRADTDQEGTFWAGYMSTWWVDPKWGIWFDSHYNVDSFFLLRGGLVYDFDAGPRVTGGYAYLLLNPDFEREEHRAWAQVFMPVHINSDWSLSTRIRTDFRFRQKVEDGEVVSGYGFNFRPRYQTMFTRRFTPTRYGRPLAQFGWEILFNAVSTTGDKVLDQNRFKFLLGVERGGFSVRIGYMNRYIANARGGDGLIEHGAILWFTHSIDLTGRHEEDPDSAYYEDP